jgi:hypothetical protein
MEKKNIITFASIAVLTALAVVIWSFPDNGISPTAPTGAIVASGIWTNPWDDVDVEVAGLAAQEWLGSDAGIKAFNNNTAGEAVPVFNEDGEPILWIIPVQDSDGLFIGYIQAETEFEDPSSYLKYQDPRETFINREAALDMHAYFIIKFGNDYAPENIGEPFVIMSEEGGYFWMSEISENGQVVERGYSPISLAQFDSDI